MGGATISGEVGDASRGHSVDCADLADGGVRLANVANTGERDDERHPLRPPLLCQCQLYRHAIGGKCERLDIPLGFSAYAERITLHPVGQRPMEVTLAPLQPAATALNRPAICCRPDDGCTDLRTNTQRTHRAWDCHLKLQ